MLLNGPFESAARAKLKRKIEVNGRFPDISAAAINGKAALPSRAAPIDARLANQLRRIPSSAVDLQMLNEGSRMSRPASGNALSETEGGRLRANSFAGSGVKLCDLDAE